MCQIQGRTLTFAVRPSPRRRGPATVGHTKIYRGTGTGHGNHKYLFEPGSTLLGQSSPQLLVILLSKPHSSHKKESVWQIRRVCQSKHNVGKQERRPSLLRENLGERRRNPAQKILLGDNACWDSNRRPSQPSNKHHHGDIGNTSKKKKKVKSI